MYQGTQGNFRHHNLDSVPVCSDGRGKKLERCDKEQRFKGSPSSSSLRITSSIFFGDLAGMPYQPNHHRPVVLFRQMARDIDLRPRHIRRFGAQTSHRPHRYCRKFLRYVMKYQ